jgi:hypothetical protein
MAVWIDSILAYTGGPFPCLEKIIRLFLKGFFYIFKAARSLLSLYHKGGPAMSFQYAAERPGTTMAVMPSVDIPDMLELE